MCDVCSVHSCHNNPGCSICAASIHPNVIKFIVYNQTARQKLSIVPSDPWPEAEKMLRRLSAGACTNSHALKQCAGTCSYARIFCASGQGSAVTMDNFCQASGMPNLMILGSKLQESKLQESINGNNSRGVQTVGRCSIMNYSAKAAAC